MRNLLTQETINSLSSELKSMYLQRDPDVDARSEVPFIRFSTVVALDLTISSVVSIVDLGSYETVYVNLFLVDKKMNRIMHCEEVEHEIDGPTISSRKLHKLTINTSTPKEHAQAWVVIVVNDMRVDIARLRELAGNYPLLLQTLIEDGGKQLLPVAEVRRRAIFASAVLAKRPFSETLRLIAAVPDDPPLPLVARVFVAFLRLFDPTSKEGSSDVEVLRWNRFIEEARKKYYPDNNHLC
ncbi:MAG: hypothetical protein ABL904_25185 [Hyphomicrobiaceae bacterium]